MKYSKPTQNYANDDDAGDNKLEEEMKLFNLETENAQMSG